MVRSLISKSTNRLLTNILFTFRFRRNLNDDIELIIGSIPLSVYQTNVTVNAEKTASPPQVGFVVPAPSAPPMEFPVNNMYPNLRKYHFSFEQKK